MCSVLSILPACKKDSVSSNMENVTNQIKQEASPATPQEIKETSHHGVIIPKEHKAQLGMVTSANEKLTGFWTPNLESVQSFEAGLLSYLEKSPPKMSPNLAQKSIKYKRQYIGFLEGEKKLIYGNFICIPLEGWTELFVEIAGGGDCFFQIVFDVQTQTYSDLSVNGGS